MEFTKEQKKKVINFLLDLFEACHDEECGETVHISEIIGSHEVSDIAKTLGFNEVADAMNNFIEAAEQFNDDNTDAFDEAYEKLQNLYQ